MRAAIMTGGTAMIVATLAAGCQADAKVATTRTSGAGSPQISTTAPSPSAVLEPGPLYSKAAATARATAVLDLVTLPGATKVSHIGAALNGAPEGTDDPQQVDVDSLWTAPGDKTAYLAHLLKHPPAGFGDGGYAGSEMQPVWAVFNRGLGNVGEIYVTAADDDGHVDLRVDVSDSWLTPRSADSIVPTRVDTAALDYTNPFPQLDGSQADTSPKPSHAHVALIGRQLSALIADLNALIPESLASRSCAADGGETATITFGYGSHSVIFSVQTGGCFTVQVNVDGRREAALGASDQLTTDIYTAIGVERTPIPRVPPQGPPVRTPVPPITVLQRNAVQAMRVARDTFDLGTPHDPSYERNAGVVARPPYQGPGTAVNWTETFSIEGTMDQLVAWYRAYPAKGTVAAEPLPAKNAVRRLVMEPKDKTQPVKVLMWVSMAQRGSKVVFRVDAQAAWKR